MGGNGGVTVTVSHLDSVESLAEGADLIDFDEDRVGTTFLDSLGQELDIGNEEVISYELAA